MMGSWHPPNNFVFSFFLSIAYFAAAPVKHGQSLVEHATIVVTATSFPHVFRHNLWYVFDYAKKLNRSWKNIFSSLISSTAANRNPIWLNYFVCREIIREIGSHANAKIWMMNESGKPQRSNAKNCDIKKGKPQLLLNVTKSSNVHWISQKHKVETWKMKAWENDKLVEP